jgi:uncharacterized protein (TIGR00255 family)
MTGFARSEGTFETCTWTWEVRSVNARGLEIRWRLPTGLEVLEPSLRQRVGAAIKRGNLFLTLTLQFASGKVQVRLNEEVLNQLLATLPGIRERLPGAPPPAIETLLGLRGVIELEDSMPRGEARERLEAVLLDGLDSALKALLTARLGEGSRLLPVLAAQITRIAEIAAEASRLAASQPKMILARLTDQVASLLESVPALPPERLAQEAALLAVKADPREELDRLKAHAEAAQALLDRNVPVGRQLDFLCQELNREANTLCAKSTDVELTRLGIELKTTIDQLREQVQNIE